MLLRYLNMDPKTKEQISAETKHQFMFLYNNSRHAWLPKDKVIQRLHDKLQRDHTNAFGQEATENVFQLTRDNMQKRPPPPSYISDEEED
jgi:hypothetical protein